MRLKLGLIFTLAVCTSSLLGCTIASKQTSIEISCDDFAKHPHVNNEIQVAVGSTITVTLCSNPTTGFQWMEAQISDQTVLEETSHEFIPPSEADGPPPPGSAGKDVWTFKALKKGTGTISVEYSRPWEGGEKGERTFRLDVTVK